MGMGASLDGGGAPSLSASPDRSSMESRTRLPPEEMKTARARARAVGLARGRCVAPLPKSAAVSFSKPGTYQYYCIVHGAEMKGTITVKP